MSLTPEASEELQDILGELSAYPAILSRWAAQNLLQGDALIPVVSDASHALRLVVRHVQQSCDPGGRMSTHEDQQLEAQPRGPQPA